MKIITQGHEIISIPSDVLATIERAGRTCYKSEEKITPDSSEKFISMLIQRGHHAMIEFGHIIVKFTTNRGVTHELVRHRLCSFAQESTRYVRYSGNMEFIKPAWIKSKGGNKDPDKKRAYELWKKSMYQAEVKYKDLLDAGWRPEQAREVLPNSLKTEIVVSANIREWRHIFSLRTAKAAHPQMRDLMIPLLTELQRLIPVVFDDIYLELQNDK